MKLECSQAGCNKACYLKATQGEDGQETERPTPTTNDELIKLGISDRGKKNTWNFQDGKLYGCEKPSNQCPGTTTPRSRDLVGA